jgi:hypothetical protein
VQVAVRARADGGEHGLARRLEAPDDQMRRLLLRDLRDRGDAAVGWKLEIDQSDIRRRRLERFLELVDVACLDHLEVAFAREQVADARPKQRSRISDQDAHPRHCTRPAVSSVVAAWRR